MTKMKNPNKEIQELVEALGSLIELFDWGLSLTDYEREFVKEILPQARKVYNKYTKEA